MLHRNGIWDKCIKKITPAQQLDRQSMWQTGPSFLMRPVEDWPISKECNVNLLPDRIKISLVNEIHVEDETCHKQSVNVGKLIEVNKFNSFCKLLAVTCMLITILRNKSFAGGRIITPQIRKHVMKLWVDEVQKDIKKKDWKNNFAD